MEIQKKDGLIVPSSYLNATEKERKKILNQCGPDGPVNKWVPNHLLGVDISESCNIHDWTFVDAKNQKEHKRSDKIFLKNMLATVDKESKWAVPRIIRRGLAYLYYGAVRVYSSLK